MLVYGIHDGFLHDGLTLNSLYKNKNDAIDKVNQIITKKYDDMLELMSYYSLEEFEEHQNYNIYIKQDADYVFWKNNLDEAIIILEHKIL